MFPGEFLVEIGSISCALDGREVRWWDPLVVDIIEIDILEEEVSLDVLSVGLTSTKSSSRVSCQELKHEHSARTGQVGRLTR